MTRREADRRSRWEQALEVGGDQRHLLLVDTNQIDPPRPPLTPDQYDRRIAWALEKYRRQLDRLEWLDDDRVPYLDCLTGTELFASAFGCEVRYSQTANPFAPPCVADSVAASRLTAPTLDAPLLAQSLSMGNELARRAGPEALLRLPDIQSPMDIAAIIWDKNDFYIAMVEEPEAVRELAEKTVALLISFLEEWFSRHGEAFVAHFPDYYMPRGITLSEDEVGAVSPQVFEQLFLPELNQLSSRFGGIGMHSCADSIHQWDGFARVDGLRLLNLVQPDEILARSYDRFAQTAILFPIPSPLHEGPDLVAAWRLAFDAVGEASIVFGVQAESEDHAKRLADSFRDALGKHG